MKKIFVLILCGVLMLSITGCGNERNTEYPSQKQVVQDIKEEFLAEINAYKVNGKKMFEDVDYSSVKFSNIEYDYNEATNILLISLDYEYSNEKYLISDNLEVQYEFNDKNYEYRRYTGEVSTNILLNDCNQDYITKDNLSPQQAIEKSFDNYNNIKMTEAKYLEEQKQCSYTYAAVSDGDYISSADLLNVSFYIYDDADDNENYYIQANEPQKVAEDEVIFNLVGKYEGNYTVNGKKQNIKFEIEKVNGSNITLKSGGYDSQYGCSYYSNTPILISKNYDTGYYEFELTGEHDTARCGMAFRLYKDKIAYECDGDYCNYLTKSN